MKSTFYISREEAKKLLDKQKEKFVTVIKNGNMKVEYYAPKKVDKQMPHSQDELYIIVSGKSDFYRDGEIIQCKKDDIIFVPAKMEHRFTNFSDDFATWVIFYGEEMN